MSRKQEYEIEEGWFCCSGANLPQVAILTLISCAGMDRHPLLRLAEDSKEVFALVLRHLDVVQLCSLSATCQLLRRVTETESLLPELQSAVSRNTRELVQRNIAADAVCHIKMATPA